ncbi:hypothetical protein ES288_D06G075500v1 [Gossypium darwinii]|nr:hypothetical protein ES288_D06G075500v1 [Gossypium darwinii]
MVKIKKKQTKVKLHKGERPTWFIHPLASLYPIQRVTTFEFCLKLPILSYITKASSLLHVCPFNLLFLLYYYILSHFAMASHGNITVISTSPKGSEAEVAPNSGKGGQCLCSPTTHQGSFRCRFHRSKSSAWMMKRSKSMPANNSPTASFSPKSVEST